MSGTLITNPDPNTISALVVKQGLKALKIGLRINRSATPKTLMRRAHEITGKTFKPRDYDGAIKAIEQWLTQPSTHLRVAENTMLKDEAL